jgi:methionyl-tRNA synthetase
MSNNFYVTTPIYYPTGLPHIGTAYTTFIADALARYHRQQKEHTFFLTGTDEHGSNIAKKANAAGKTPQEYVDDYARQYQEIWQSLGISYDYFVRTTNPEHEKFAQHIIQKAYDNGDLYEATYEGWYCESCEAYYSVEDLVEGKCPNHPTREPVWTKESNYYFRWSKYQNWLLEYYEQHPQFVKPTKWFDYVKEFVAKGLQDIPVTRANVKWGVPVPFAPNQTIYVWYDALPNYLSVLHFAEFADQNYVEKFWPEAIHVIGKDIIKFHAILWPAMLHSAGYQPPKTVLTHGFFTINGQKIGKSNNNAIVPTELTAKYGNDAIRYALLSEFKVGNDGDFNFERLEARYIGDLASNWGNLHSRIQHLAAKYEINANTITEVQDNAVAAELDLAKQKYHQAFADLEIFEATQVVNSLATFGNRFIAAHKPWELEADQAKPIISDLAVLIKTIAELYVPILPDAAQKALDSLESGEKVILFPKLV